MMPDRSTLLIAGTAVLLLGGIAAPKTAPALSLLPSAHLAESPATERAAMHMASLINEHRRSVGCGELTWLDGAGQAAQAHSEDMLRHDHLEHVTLEGATLRMRLRSFGISPRIAGENLAQSAGPPAQVLQLWLRSPGHRENLQDCTFTHHGIGVAGDRWTHVLVAPR